jgi:hypothetical protein
MGAGDLIDVYDVQLKLDDGEKVISTLRANPSGSSAGARAGEITWKSYISADGVERDYFGDYLNRKVKQMRAKVPGLTFVFMGRLTSPALAINVENPTEMTWTLKGKWTVEKI